MVVQVSPSPWFAPTLAALLERRNLSGLQVREMMHGLNHGDCCEVERASLRGALRSIRPLFNCLGPRANPARASFQLLGVGQAAWLDRMAEALARLETGRAFLVCGRDGLDEVSLSGPTLVREVNGGTVTSFEWTPDDFGLPPSAADKLRATGPQQNAALIRSVLSAKHGPALDIVLANAAAALLVAGRV